MRKLLLCFSLSMGALHSGATTYNAVTSFSSSSNPNGVWSYGYGTPQNFKLYNVTTTTSDGTTSWISSAIGSLPTISYNPAGFTTTTPTVPGTEIGLHPGPATTGQDSILEFIAPTTGIYNLTSSFTRRDNTPYGNGVDVGVYLDGAALSGSTDYLSNTSGHTPFVYNNAALSLVAGDTVMFDVNNNGEYTYDTTGVTAAFTNQSISTTPEPSSLILLGTGVLATVGMTRRKRFGE